MKLLVFGEFWQSIWTDQAALRFKVRRAGVSENMVNCIMQFSSIWRFKILFEGWRDWCRNFRPQIIEVRHQCCLSPYLFIIYMNNIMEYINDISTCTPTVVWFYFADYVAVCLCTGNGLQKKTDKTLLGNNLHVTELKSFRTCRHNTIYSILTTIITFTLQLTLCLENIISKMVSLDYLIWANTCPVVCALLWACYGPHMGPMPPNLWTQLCSILHMMEPLVERQQCWVMR